MFVTTIIKLGPTATKEGGWGRQLTRGYRKERGGVGGGGEQRWGVGVRGADVCTQHRALWKYFKTAANQSKLTVKNIITPPHAPAPHQPQPYSIST